MWASRDMIVVGCALALAVTVSNAAGEPTEPALRVARSEDGLSFEDTGEIVAANAWAPGLVVLPNEGLLAVFDQGARPGSTALALARSKDDGRSWSRPQPIRITWPNAGAPQCNHGELIIPSDGLLRLFFLVEPVDSGPGSPTASGVLVMGARGAATA